MNSQIRISVLTDNHAGPNTLAEHGLSYLIEYDGKRLLFDTGQSDVFLKNADRMNISLERIEMIVLSHGHFDHGNGLNHLSDCKLLCHPGCFVRRYRKKDHEYIGLSKSKNELDSKYELILSDTPYKISENIYFLGGIPRRTDFESQTSTFVFEDGTPDLVMDDSALALILPEGLLVITGCGHAGVVNTIDHAVKVTGADKIFGIIGGFHLKEHDLQLQETIEYLKQNNVKFIRPSHCTELPALSAFYDNFGISQLRTGDIITF